MSFKKIEGSFSLFPLPLGDPSACGHAQAERIKVRGSGLKLFPSLITGFIPLMICQCVFIFIFIAANVAAAKAAEGKVLTRDELILLLEERFEAIESYKCIMKIEVYDENGKTQYQEQEFIFKKPGMIHCEQLGPYKKGVVLTVDRDGRIGFYWKGFWAGFWKYAGKFSKKLFKKENSDLFKGITGETILQLDWGYIINEIKRLKDKVDSYSIKSQIIDSRDTYVFESRCGQEGFLFHIDKELMVIVKLERFLNGKIDNSVVWEKIEINIELEDDFFEI